MNIKKVAAVGAAFGLAAAGLAVAIPASANPVGNSDGYVLAGSDTIQDVVSALANGYTVSGVNVRATANGHVLTSFDAFPNTFGTPGELVETKPFGPYFERPSGSGGGISALSSSIGDSTQNGATGSYNWTTNGHTYSIQGQVDLARSSAGPVSNAAGDLEFVPFARDAVDFAIYFGSAVSNTDKTTVEGWGASDIASLLNSSTGTEALTGSDVVAGFLPQSSSGTRQFYTTLLGLPGGKNFAPGSSSVAFSSTYAENDGIAIAAFAAAANTLSIAGTDASHLIVVAPFSVAQYTAQFNGIAPSNTTAGLVLGTPFGTAPVTLAAGKVTPNVAYYHDTTWGRDTYIVVPYAKYNPSSPTYDADLAQALDPENDSSLISFYDDDLDITPVGLVKQTFGFLEPLGVPTRAYHN